MSEFLESNDNLRMEVKKVKNKNEILEKKLGKKLKKSKIQ